VEPVADVVTDEPEGRGAGGCLLLAASFGTAVAVYAYSRDAFVLLVWAVGSILIHRAARKKVVVTVDPAPPATSERGSQKEPQVTMVRDVAHPNRWIVIQDSPWMTEEIDKEAGTT
jgi:hypothetical protein